MRADPRVDPGRSRVRKAFHEMVADADTLRRSLFGRSGCRGADCRICRQPGWVCPVLSQLLDVSGQARHLHRGSLHPARVPREGIGREMLPFWPEWRSSATAVAWNGRCWTGTRAPSISTGGWAPSADRVDCLPAGRRSAAGSFPPVLNPSRRPPR